MQRLNEDIKSGQLRRIYLLYGEEAYLRKQYRDKLRSALLDPADTINYNYFEGKNQNVGTIIDLAETMPFFAERRVIVIENSGLFKSGGEQLAEYLKSVPESVTLIFVDTEVDKRSRLFKAVKDKGYAAEFPAQEEATLKKWILVMLKKENKKITEVSLNRFLSKTGTDMSNIQKELEKLVCYCLDRDTITEEDVEMLTTTRISNRIFDMIGAIAEKKQKVALDLYYDLLALKEPPMRILFLTARQFNLLLQVKELKRKGHDGRSIAGKTGLPSFVVGKYAAQAAGFDDSILREAVTACVEAEENVKTGRMNDVMSVELLIIRYTSAV